MNNSRLTQTLKYQLSYFGWSSLWVYGIAIGVISIIGLLITTAVYDGSVTHISGIGGVGFIHLLIVGICGIRSDLRFFIQHGIGRRTTFFSNFYGSIICSVVLGLFCEVFNLISYYWLGFTIYGSAFTVQGFLTNWMMYSFAFIFAWQVGALISLIYYRLNKMQQIIFTVIAIATVVFGFTYGIRFLVRADEALLNTFDYAIETIVGNLFGFTFGSLATWAALLVGMLAALGNYLLIRRVQIKE